MEARTQTIEPFGLSTPPEVRNKPHSLMFGDWIFCAVIVGDFIALVCALSLAFLEREYFSFGLTPREFRPSMALIKSTAFYIVSIS
jgi:hypothetical protein